MLTIKYSFMQRKLYFFFHDLQKTSEAMAKYTVEL